MTGVSDSASPESAGRFRREIQVASLLRNPHIVETHDAGEAVVDGRPVLYLVMEEVPGDPLNRVLAARRPSLAEVARWGGEICEALAAMHGAGIVHRDLKPANVMIRPDGHATVLDFGIARLDATGIDLTTLTRTGHVLGTVAYMSPEQADGGSDVDARSDLYSLGCLLYAALTGGPPFADGPWQRILLQHMDDMPAAPSLRREGLPPAWDTLLLELLAKRPEHRPASAEAVRDRLRALPLPPPDRTLPEGAPVAAPPLAATLVDPDAVMTERMAPDGSPPDRAAGTEGGSRGNATADAVTQTAAGRGGPGAASAEERSPTGLSTKAQALGTTGPHSGEVISRGLTWARLLAVFVGAVVLLLGLVAIALIASGRSAGQAVTTSALIVVSGFGGFLALAAFYGLYRVDATIWRPRRLEWRFQVWSYENEQEEALRVLHWAMRRGRSVEVCLAQADESYTFCTIVPGGFFDSLLVGRAPSGEEYRLAASQLVTVRAVRDPD